MDPATVARGEPALSVRGLGVRRGGRWVLRDCSFSATAGEIVVVVGPNGAGKSSLLEAIAGTLPRAEGSVHAAGASLDSLSARARVLALMPDGAEPPAEVAVKTVIGAAARAMHAPRQLAARLRGELGLEPLLEARAGALSRGEKARVALFAALCHERPLVLLDEPLAAFDPLQVQSIAAALRARSAAGVTILMSAHQLSDAQRLASRVLLLDAGRVLACDSLEGLRRRAATPGGSLEEVFVALLGRTEAHDPA